MSHLSILRVEQEDASFHFVFNAGDHTLQVSRPGDQVASFLHSIPVAGLPLTLTGPTLCTLFSDLLHDERTQLQVVCFLDDEHNPCATLHTRRVLDQMGRIQSSLEGFGTRICGLEDQMATARRLIERLLDVEEANLGSDGEYRGDRTRSSSTALDESSPPSAPRPPSQPSPPPPAALFLCDASVHSSDCSAASPESDAGSSPSLGRPQAAPRPSLDPHLASFQKLRDDLASLEGHGARFADELHALLAALQPSDRHRAWQHSVVAWLRRSVRAVLQGSLVEVGLAEIGCALPDDPLCVSVLLHRSQTAGWHLALCEGLAAGGEASGPSSSSSSSSTSQALSGLQAVPVHGGHVVRFAVHGTAVEVSANERSPLCFAAFLAEMDQLVGGGLFSQSLRLVRAWWRHCSAAFVERSIAHYLPWDVLALMLCAVFNLHHRRVRSPLQALLFFLADFSAMDVARHVVTLDGVVPHVVDGQPLVLARPSPFHLVGRDTLEKYWQLFHLGAAGEAGMRLEYPSYAQTTRQGFDKRGFGVLHPFTHQPMLARRVSTRRAQYILRALRGGAVAMKAALVAPVVTGENLRGVLPQLLATLRQAPRGDGPADWTPERDTADYRALASSDGDRVWQSILFANFVLEQVVSESAILTAAVEALGARGPLPVGEVGKILTEVSGMPQLSLHLKERFGGLKKFLEKFLELFVFSNDHPFNPHVLLRSALGPDLQKIVYRGVIPTQIMAQFKKTPEKKRGKAAKAPPFPPPPDAAARPRAAQAPTPPSTSSSSSSLSAPSPTPVVWMAAHIPPAALVPRSQPQRGPAMGLFAAAGRGGLPPPPGAGGEGVFAHPAASVAAFVRPPGGPPPPAVGAGLAPGRGGYGGALAGHSHGAGPVPTLRAAYGPPSLSLPLRGPSPGPQSFFDLPDSRTSWY